MLNFKIFFDASPNAAMVLDRELRFVAANPAYLRTCGVDRVESLLGRHVFEAFPNDPDDSGNLGVRMLRASFARVLRDAVVDHVPLIAYDTGDGEVRYWSATHTPIFADDGVTVEYVLQLTVDVTQLGDHERESSKAMISAGVLARAQDAAERNTALNAERERLLMLLDKAPAFVAVLRGKDHVFELVNEAYAKVVGHRDVLGKSVAEAVPEVVGQGFVKILDGVFSTGKKFEARGLAIQLQHVAGGPMSTSIIDLTYQAIVEADGSISGILVHGTDLTDQRELERHYEELSTIVSQSSKSMAIADKNGFVTYVNDSGRRVHGLSGIVGLHARDLIAAEDRHLYDQLIVPTVVKDGQWQGELRLLGAEGVSFPAHHNAFALRNKDGVVIGSASISRDLSADKAAQRERDLLAVREADARRLADSRDRERLFLAESIPQQVWTASADGVVDYVNARTVEYMGASPISDLHSGFIDFIHDADRAPMIERWSQVMLDGSLFEATFRLRRHDGEWRWYLARAVPFRDEHGVVVKWFGTNTDIHDARLANDELQQRTEFEQQLIGIVSHDLRNPLNAIGLSSAALDTPAANLDERRKAAVGRIVSATHRATRLINDLLDFSQARSTGFIPVFPEKTSLRLLVKSVVDELAEAHPKRQLSVEHSGEELVLVDHDRLTQVVGNLVGNALQHSLEDCVVAVRSRVDGDAAVITVHNDGTIVADDIPKLFQPFQQGAGHGTRAARSVGLGLYIAAQLVQAHGGTIDVTSTSEAGTTFTVTLPRGEAKPR